MVDILRAALKSSLRELGGTPGERGKVAPYEGEVGVGAARRGVVGLLAVYSSSMFTVASVYADEFE
jgi:hypothetical protein